MKYPTNCTYCLPQLLNLKKYSNAKFYSYNNQTYLDIEDLWERHAIIDLEKNMQEAHEALQRLTEITEK